MACSDDTAEEIIPQASSGWFNYKYVGYTKYLSDFIARQKVLKKVEDKFHSEDEFLNEFQKLSLVDRKMFATTPFTSYTSNYILASALMIVQHWYRATHYVLRYTTFSDRHVSWQDIKSGEVIYSGNNKFIACELQAVMRYAIPSRQYTLISFMLNAYTKFFQDTLTHDLGDVILPHHEDLTLLKILCDFGVDWNYSHGPNAFVVPLVWALIYYSEEAICMMLKAGADVNYQPDEAPANYLYARFICHFIHKPNPSYTMITRKCKLLFDHGYDLHRLEMYDVVKLFEYLEYHPFFSELLTKNQFLIRKTSTAGVTVLEHACAYYRASVCKRILQYEWDLNYDEGRKCSLIGLSAIGGIDVEEKIKLLIEAGANPHQIASVISGETSLELLAKRKCYDLVEYILVNFDPIAPQLPESPFPTDSRLPVISSKRNLIQQ